MGAALTRELVVVKIKMFQFDAISSGTGISPVKNY
jgi:hypothetical protein